MKKGKKYEKKVHQRLHARNQPIFIMCVSASELADRQKEQTAYKQVRIFLFVFFVYRFALHRHHRLLFALFLRVLWRAFFLVQICYC